jgi:hypothetical protein
VQLQILDMGQKVNLSRDGKDILIVIESCPGDIQELTPIFQLLWPSCDISISILTSILD